MLGNPMLLVDTKQLHKLFSWGRYLYWADIQRKKFIDYDAEHQPAKGAKAEWRLFAVASQRSTSNFRDFFGSGLIG